MEQSSENPGGDLPGSLVDGHDAPHVQGGIAFVLLPGEDLELGVQHGQLAEGGVEFDLPVEGDPAIGNENVGEVAGMEPLACQNAAGAVGEGRLKHS